MVGYSFFIRKSSNIFGFLLTYSYLCPLKLSYYQMKRVIIALSVVVAALILGACGNKKKSEDIIAQRVVKAAPQGPIRMPENTDQREVNWISKTYQVTIHRQPADTLSMVKDENGQQFVDNIFTLTVARQDGSVFFTRKFVKSDFSRLVGDDFHRTGILEGFVFDKANGDWLEFGASVGRPQTDEYIPLVVRLSRMGNLEMKVDTQLDTNSDLNGAQPAVDNDEDGV